MMPNVSYCGYKTTNIKHGWRLSLKLMTNLSLIYNYSNACLGMSSYVLQNFPIGKYNMKNFEMQTYNIIIIILKQKFKQSEK